MTNMKVFNFYLFKHNLQLVILQKFIKYEDNINYVQGKYSVEFVISSRCKQVSKINLFYHTWGDHLDSESFRTLIFGYRVVK